MKIFFIILFAFFSLSSYAQVKIRMEEDGGVYKVPCEVNGLRMKFIFDTGASNVCLSLAEARFMLENDYISKEDILGSSKSQIADGSIVENTIVRLKEIKISGLTLRDVEATITHSFGAPLLLGQSAIQKLGTIQINGNELTILEHSQDISDEELDKMFKDASKFYDNGSYAAAAKIYQELYDLDTLTDYGIYKLASSYYHSEKYVEALSYYNKIKDFSKINKAIYYSSMGWCNVMLDKYDDALYCFELQGEYAGDDNTLFTMSKEYMGYTYQYMEDYDRAYDIFETMFNILIKRKNLDQESAIKQIRKGKLKDDKIDKYLYEMMYCGYMKSGRPTNGLKALINLAKYGNKYALDFVRKHELEQFLYD